MANPHTPGPDDPRPVDPLNPVPPHTTGDPRLDPPPPRGGGSAWIIALIVVVLALAAYYMLSLIHI